MSLQFNCPGCHKPITAEEERAGEESNCPHCQWPVTVPAESEPPVPTLTPEEALQKKRKALHKVADNFGDYSVVLAVIGAALLIYGFPAESHNIIILGGGILSWAFALSILAQLLHIRALLTK